MRVAILAALLAFSVAQVTTPATSAHGFAQTRGRHVQTTPVPDAGLSLVASAISGRETVVNCGGNGFGTWGQVPVAEGGGTEPLVFLEPLLCTYMRRFEAGWRPNAACYRKPDRCSVGYLGLSALVLTHESIHVEGDLDEASTECRAAQRVRRTFRLLGEAGNPLYVEALARYAWWWHLQETTYVDVFSGTRPYFSPECKSGGALDESPADGVWP